MNKSTISRRAFLRGMFALTAAAATPKAIAQLIEIADARSVIEWQTFYLREPMTIDRDDFLIRFCKFIAVDGFQGPLLKIKGSGGIIRECNFQIHGVRKPIVIEYPVDDDDEDISGFSMTGLNA